MDLVVGLDSGTLPTKAVAVAADATVVATYSAGYPLPSRAGLRRTRSDWARRAGCGGGARRVQ